MLNDEVNPKGLSRLELLKLAQALRVSDADVMTRAELQAAIERARKPEPRPQSPSVTWLGVARRLLASIVEQGLHLPDAAALIRGDNPLRPTPSGPPPVATVTLARIYAAQGHLERGISTLDEVLASDPDHDLARELRSQLATRLEERRRQEALLAKAAAGSSTTAAAKPTNGSAAKPGNGSAAKPANGATRPTPAKAPASRLGPSATAAFDNEGTEPGLKTEPSVGVSPAPDSAQVDSVGISAARTDSDELPVSAPSTDSSELADSVVSALSALADSVVSALSALTDPIEVANSVDLAAPVDVANSVDLAAPGEVANSVDLGAPVEVANSVDLAAPVEVANSVDLAAPVEVANAVEPAAVVEALPPRAHGLVLIETGAAGLYLYWELALPAPAEGGAEPHWVWVVSHTPHREGSRRRERRFPVHHASGAVHLEGMSAHAVVRAKLTRSDTPEAPALAVAGLVWAAEATELEDTEARFLPYPAADPRSLAARAGASLAKAAPLTL